MAENQFAGFFDAGPDEEAVDNSLGGIEFLAGTADEDVGATGIENAVVIKFHRVVAKAGRPEAIGAVDKELGLRRNGVEIDRCCDQDEIGLGEVDEVGIEVIVVDAERGRGVDAAGLTGDDIKVIEADADRLGPGVDRLEAFFELLRQDLGRASDARRAVNDQ